MDGIDYKGDPRAVLCHFNLNHDPKTGKFSKKGSGRTYGAAPSTPNPNSNDLGFGMDKYVTTDASGKRVLTELGKQRLAYDVKRNAQKKKDDQIKGTQAEIEAKLTDPHRWVTEDLNSYQQGLQSAQNMTKSIKDFEQRKLDSRPKVRKKKLDLSNMTDQELNAQINRYLLEQRYQDIFNPKEPPEVSKGKQWLLRTLEIAGAAAGVGVSAVTIAKAIHDMKKVS